MPNVCSTIDETGAYDDENHTKKATTTTTSTNMKFTFLHISDHTIYTIAIAFEH